MVWNINFKPIESQKRYRRCRKQWTCMVVKWCASASAWKVRTQKPEYTGFFIANTRMTYSCSTLWLVNFALVLPLCLALYITFTYSDKMPKILAYVDIWTIHQGSLFLCSVSPPSYSRLISNKKFLFRRWGLCSRGKIYEGCKDKRKTTLLLKSIGVARCCWCQVAFLHLHT